MFLSKKICCTAPRARLLRYLITFTRVASGKKKISNSCQSLHLCKRNSKIVNNSNIYISKENSNMF